MSGVRLPDGFIDEIKSRLRPSDVIGRKVKLTRRGKEWVGLSPFTSEKTPSFYVNDQKGIFKDFSSGLGGDIISFLQETERLSFMEAVERLAEEAGLAMPTASPEEEARYDRLSRLKEACAAAADFFQKTLVGRDGASARAYLEQKRRLGPEAWARWGIGLAPDDWRQLRTHLLRSGFKDDELADAGLIKSSDKGGEPYDVFRNRIMFPIADARGDIIAFGGRALDPDDKAKYLNSPETPLFHKSRVLYNFRSAREAIGYGERGGLIVCEGYMDVIAMGEAGFANAVAPLGTALTAEQLSMVWKAGPDPVMCFDGDAAGLRAAHKTVTTALPHVLPDRSVYFCFLPDGLDPDDMLGQPGGRERMGELLEASRPLIEVLWTRERDAEPLDTPERKAGLEARLKSAARVIEHQGVRAAYDRDLGGRMREHFWQMRSASRGSAAKGGGAPSTIRNSGRPPPSLGQLVRAACSPELLDVHSELLARVTFDHVVSDAICDAIMGVYCDAETLTRDAVAAEIARTCSPQVLDAFNTYPNVSRIAPDSDEARAWELNLRAYCKDEVAQAPDAMDREDYFRRDDAMADLHRRIAERQRLRAEASEAQMAAHEAAKKPASGS